jgi:hypothetical protein
MSIILAKILGIYFLALGLAFFINTDLFKNIYKQVSRDKNFLLMGGIVAMSIGAVIVSLHNIWVWDWPLIITILGWWSLIKGFGFIANPDFVKLFSFIDNRSFLFYKILSLVYVAVGFFLLYKGWKG